MKTFVRLIRRYVLAAVGIVLLLLFLVGCGVLLVLFSIFLCILFDA